MKQEQAGAPWWKHGYVWLVIAGPAAAVIAGLATVWIAVGGGDPLLAEGRDRKPLQIERTATKDRALLPALQGRNHAATPDAAPVPARQQ
ncbi:MAG: nitrogen fixation protein FixH [Ramlibacter sp.]|nr:nitrogen fixation protein FixH [Ramlibacter sp.]